MLALTRQFGEAIFIDIGGGVWIRPLREQNGHVKIAIDAPREVHILRSELYRPEDHGATDAVTEGAVYAPQYDAGYGKRASEPPPSAAGEPNSPTLRKATDIPERKASGKECYKDNQGVLRLRKRDP